MKHHNNLSSRQQQDQQTGQEQVSQTGSAAVQEFGSVEEMLRHDALHTPLPPDMGKRLQESLGPVAPPPRSWWRRFFGA